MLRKYMWMACLGGLFALTGPACSDEADGTGNPGPVEDSGTPPVEDSATPPISDSGNPPVDSGTPADSAVDSAVDASMCNVELLTDELLDQTFAPCDCPGAHCIAASLAAGFESELQVPCADPTQLCVPDPLIKTSGNYRPPTCTSVDGFEGRCMSKCLATVQALAAALPAATCDETELCVPCYDPFGNSTTACDLECDTPPAPPPPETCCPNAMGTPEGTCVSDAFLSLQITDPQELEDTKALLRTCTSGKTCVPNAYANGVPEPTPCEALILEFIPAGEGACTSSCVKAREDIGVSLLGKSTCANGEFCAPCRQDDVPTGACPWDPVVTEEPPVEEPPAQ